MTRLTRSGVVSPRELSAALGQPAPTDQQAEIIAAPAEPTLVIAGAGSGKTETIAQRVVYLIANGQARPGDILGLTFTRKAAGELAARIRRRLRTIAAAGIGDLDALKASVESQPEISTYHSFAGHMIAEFGPLVGIESSARVLTPTATWQLARDVVRKWDGDLETDHSPERVTQDILDVSGALADHLTDIDELDAELERIIDAFRDAPASARQQGAIHSDLKPAMAALMERRAALPLVRAFVRAKRAMHAIDFADQMQLAARVVAQSDHAGEVLRARFPMVFLDEYQDTGHSQRIILRGLFGDPGTAGAAGADGPPPWRGHAVTAVGDPVQSIYSWRGASASNLPRFVSDFPKRDGSPAEQRELLISFRNDRAILTIANAVSQPVRRSPVPVGTLEPSRAAEQGTVRAALHATVDDENDWLADNLANAWNNTDTRPTVAVLVRRRASMSGIAHVLRQRGLPVEIVGVGGLVDEPEVADIIAMLRLIVDHQAGPSAIRILTGARWRLGMSDLAALARRAHQLEARSALPQSRPRHESEALAAMRSALTGAIGSEDIENAGLVDAIADPGEVTEYSSEGWRRVNSLRTELQRLRDGLTTPVTDLIRDIERTLRLDVEVLLTPQRRAHLDAFASVVADLAAHGAGAVELLDYLATAAQREDGLAPGDVDVATDRIQVLTIHAAKGLEWDVVAIPHLSTGVLPSSMNGVWLGESSGLPPAVRGDREDVPDFNLPQGADQAALGRALKDHRAQWKERHLVEERRLFYVAVTRARHGLFLSAHHWSATRKEPPGPSEFFTELVDCGAASGATAGAEKPVAEKAAEPVGVPTVAVDAVDAVEQDRSGGWTPLLPEICAEAPEVGATNPLLDAKRTGVWPIDPLGARREAVQAAAARVRAAISQAPTWDADIDATEASEPDNDPDGWERDARLLLAERNAERSDQRIVDVEMPTVMSVSALVALAADPNAVARRIRRPLPQAPSPQARKGTAFHAWLERFYGGEPLLNMAEVPGAGDDVAADDARLDELIAAFRASSWASRTPIAVEVPFVTHVAGVAIRGRMDAVFAEPDGGVSVVDWKTGPPPGPERARSMAVQLIAYRLAWARLHDLPLDSVQAAFHYVADNLTVRPPDLMDAQGLRRLIDDSVGARANPEAAARPDLGGARP